MLANCRLHEERHAAHGIKHDTPCMKALVVKGIVFFAVFLLVARFCEAVEATADRTLFFSLFLPVVFVLRPWLARDVVSS
jgi:hypothetical protein